MIAFRGGAAGHVRLASTFATGDGGEVFDEVAGAVTGVVSVFSAEGAEVELVAVIDDEEGGVGEVDFFAAVEELLKQGGRALGADDHVAGEVLFGNEGVGEAGGSGGFGFFEGFLGLDGGVFEIGEATGGLRHDGGTEGLESFVGGGE